MADVNDSAPGTKVCTGCAERKPLEAFHLLGGPDRRRARCRACVSAYMRERAAHIREANAPALAAAARLRLEAKALELERRRLHGKACGCCGVVRPLENFEPRSGWRLDGRGSKCSDCRNAKKRRRYARDPSSSIARRRAYSQAHADELRMKWLQRSADLADSYIVKRLTDGSPGLRAKNIPRSLIELKREQLRLRRLAKEFKQAVSKAKEDQ